MKKIFFRTALSAAALGLAAALPGCGPDILALTEMDNGKHLTCAAGDVIEIRLPGNPTTGFSWAEAAAPSSAVLVKTGEEFRMLKSKQPLVGAPGTFFFKYKVTGKGEEGIRLQYRRPWETSPPQSRFEVLIRAE